MKAFKEINENVNIYRTKFYIIVQNISVITNLNGTTCVHSYDEYFARTRKLDREFNLLFLNSNFKNGKRVHTTTLTKKYM